MTINDLTRHYGRLKILGLAVGTLVLIASVGWLSLSVSAVTATKPKGLTLSPLRSELEISPGTSLDGTLTVTNSTDRVMAVHLNAEQFSVINPQYDYAFSAESDLAKWVTFNPGTANLAAGETKVISFAVGVPLTAEPGGRYISLFVSSDTEAAAGVIISRQRVASLLYITVLGNVTRSGHLVSLSSPWVVGGKSLWNMALQNSGTTHFRSRYSVSVQTLLGAEVATARGDGLILPGTVRAISDNLPAPSLPGFYKIVYMIGLGDTPLTVETRYLLYLPPAAVVTGAVAVLLLVARLRRRQSVQV